MLNYVKFVQREGHSVRHDDIWIFDDRDVIKVIQIAQAAQRYLAFDPRHRRVVLYRPHESLPELDSVQEVWRHWQ